MYELTEVGRIVARKLLGKRTCLLYFLTFTCTLHFVSFKYLLITINLSDNARSMHTQNPLWDSNIVSNVKRNEYELGGHWYKLPESSESTKSGFIYSAYWIREKRVVRMLAIVHQVQQTQILCKILFIKWRNTTDSYFISSVLDWPKIVDVDRHWKRFGIRFMDCRMPKNKSIKKITHVQLIHKKHNGSTKPIPVTEITHDIKHNFTVCMQPFIFNYPDINQFISFMETSQLFGASHFIFYNHSMGASLEPYLRSYIDDGLVTMLPWDIPIQEIHNFGQLVALQDCLYRSKGTSRYIVVMDFDEMIVPLHNDRWHDMIAEITKHKPHLYSSFLFRNMIVAMDSSHKLESKPKPLDYKDYIIHKYQVIPLLYTKEHALFNYFYRMKYICDTNTVDFTSLHYPVSYRRKKIDVSVQDSYVLHYRKNFNLTAKPAFALLVNSTQNRMLDFTETLVARIQNRMNKIN